MCESGESLCFFSCPSGDHVAYWRSSRLLGQTPRCNLREEALFLSGSGAAKYVKRMKHWICGMNLLKQRFKACGYGFLVVTSCDGGEAKSFHTFYFLTFSTTQPECYCNVLCPVMCWSPHRCSLANQFWGTMFFKKYKIRYTRILIGPLKVIMCLLNGCFYKGKIILPPQITLNMSVLSW